MIARLVPAVLLSLFGVAFLAPGIGAEVTDATVARNSTVARIAEDRHALIVRIHHGDRPHGAIVRLSALVSSDASPASAISSSLPGAVATPSRVSSGPGM